MVLAHVRNEVVLTRELAWTQVARVHLDAQMHRVDVARKVLLTREFLGAERAADGIRVGVHLDVPLQAPLVHERRVAQVALVAHPQIGDCVVVLLVPDERSCIIAREVTVAAFQIAGLVTLWEPTVVYDLVCTSIPCFKVADMRAGFVEACK